MVVFSAFDGMACARVALERAGVVPSIYLASEVDKYAIKVAMTNYPNIVQLGDIKQAHVPPKIDLLVGGSPCQSFSASGKKRGFDDSRGQLFFDFAHFVPRAKYFLFENVKMSAENEKIITRSLGVEPIVINSNLVSAQNRLRMYWTNIPNVQAPKDRGVTWGHIREHDVARKYYYSKKGLAWIHRHSKRNNKILRIWDDDDKCQMVEAGHYKNYSSQRFFGIRDVHGLRYITVEECERAQTAPRGYTAHVSNTQRYKMLGNGMTIDMIAHIFSFLPSCFQLKT